MHIFPIFKFPCTVKVELFGSVYDTLTPKMKVVSLYNKMAKIICSYVAFKVRTNV